MRCILAGSLAAGIGLTTIAGAQAQAWSSGSINPMNQPAVTLGPPAVSLGAPRPMAVSAGGDIARCGFGVAARAVADDKAPMPPGPVLSTNPAAAASPLPAPTPLPSAGATYGFGADGSNPAGVVMDGPVMSGPVSSDGSPSGPLPGQPCPTCCPDPGWAALPGGVFSADAQPCGYIFYGSAEALFWWVRGSQLPPLLVSSPGAPPFTGVGATTIIGGQDIAQQGRIGGRFTAGWWIDRCQNYGLVGSFFFLGNRGQDFAAASGPNNQLARVFLNVNPAEGGSPTSPVLGFEPLQNGTFIARTTSELWGADINGRFKLWNGCRYRVDGLLGFRYLRLDEQLNIAETSSGSFVTPDMVLHTASGSVADNFKATNDFYGGQVGLIGEVRRGPWSMDVGAKVAMGTTHESLTATGAQSGLVDAASFSRPFGLLVQPSNSGFRSRDVFAVVPEVTLNLGYQVTPHFKVFGGYDFLYWSRVARVADQVDTTLDVNTRTLPPISQPAGAMRPATIFQDTGFWAQGFNVGLQFTW